MKLPVIIAVLGMSLALIYVAFQAHPLPVVPDKLQDERYLSSIPFTQQTKDFYSRVQQSAKNSTSIDIANCVSNPRIIRLRNHSQLLIKNTGPVGHYISVQGKFYFLGTKKSIEISIDSDTTPLVYSLACDVPGPLAGGGVILVTN